MVVAVAVAVAVFVAVAAVAVAVAVAVVDAVVINSPTELYHLYLVRMLLGSMHTKYVGWLSRFGPSRASLDSVYC